MPLNPQERKATTRELQANFALTGLSLAEVATDLGTTEGTIQNVLNLETRHINNPWILRAYLIEKLEEQGIQPVPFSRLVGDPEDYWFLDANLIHNGQIEA